MAFGTVKTSKEPLVAVPVLKVIFKRSPTTIPCEDFVIVISFPVCEYVAATVADGSLSPTETNNCASTASALVPSKSSHVSIKAFLVSNKSLIKSALTLKCFSSSKVNFEPKSRIVAKSYIPFSAISPEKSKLDKASTSVTLSNSKSPDNNNKSKVES